MTKYPCLYNENVECDLDGVCRLFDGAEHLCPRMPIKHIAPKKDDSASANSASRQCPFHSAERLCAKQDFRRHKVWVYCEDQPCTITRPQPADCPSCGFTIGGTFGCTGKPEECGFWEA